MPQFEVSRDLIIHSCKNAINSISKRRKELFDASVTKTMEGTFGFFKVGKEEATDIVMTSGDGMEDWKISGWGTLDKAESLLAACKVCCNETVYLTVSDAAFVSKWEYFQE